MQDIIVNPFLELILEARFLKLKLNFSNLLNGSQPENLLKFLEDLFLGNLQCGKASISAIDEIGTSSVNEIKINVRKEKKKKKLCGAAITANKWICIASNDIALQQRECHQI